MESIRTLAWSCTYRAATCHYMGCAWNLRTRGLTYDIRFGSNASEDGLGHAELALPIHTLAEWAQQ